MPITSAKEAMGIVLCQTESVGRFQRKVRTETSVNTKGLVRRVSCSPAEAFAEAKTHAFQQAQNKTSITVPNLSLCPMVCHFCAGFQKKTGQTMTLPVQGKAHVILGF
jgi:hypothetical protein